MITVSLDTFDFYYLIEGLAKYGNNSDIERVTKYVVPAMGKRTRESILQWFVRDCSYLYEKNSHKTYEEFIAALEDTSEANDYDGIEVTLSMHELKCYVKSCGFGSHLRQGVWEWMVNYVYPRLTGIERKEIGIWLPSTFGKYFNRDQKYVPCGVDDYERCLARYKPSNRCVVFLEYRMGGKEGTERVNDAYLYNGEYFIDWSKVACPWSRGDDYVRVKNVLRSPRSMPRCCSCANFRRNPLGEYEGRCGITQEGRNRRQEICNDFKNLNRCIRKDTK